MAVTTATGIASMSGGYIPEIWSGKMLGKYYAASTVPAISNTDYVGEVKNKGDKVIIRTVPDITIRDYVIGQKLLYDRPEGSEIELIVDKAKYFSFVINEVEKHQADVPYMEKWSDDAGEQMKIAIDSHVLATLYTGAHADNKGATAGAISSSVNLGASGSAYGLTKSNIIDYITMVGQVLDEQNVPEQGRWMVLPAWACQRIKTSDLKDASLTGDSVTPLRNGRIGMIDRFTIYKSNLLPSVTDTHLCFHAPAGHRDAFCFVSQIAKSEMLDNPDDFGQLVRGLQVYGWKVLRPEALVDMYVYAATA